MKYSLTFLLCLIFSFANAQDKKICITVDDLPVVTYGNDEPIFAKEITIDLMNTFNKYDIPAIGYVNELNHPVLKAQGGLVFISLFISPTDSNLSYYRKK